MKQCSMPEGAAVPDVPPQVPEKFIAMLFESLAITEARMTCEPRSLLGMGERCLRRGISLRTKLEQTNRGVTWYS